LQRGFANFTPNAATTYNFANDKRAPLLFIAGRNDHVLLPAVQHENFVKNAKRSRAISAYKLFEGRSHYTCGEKGWENVADFALDWALAPATGASAKPDAHSQEALLPSPGRDPVRGSAPKREGAIARPL